VVRYIGWPSAKEEENIPLICRLDLIWNTYDNLGYMTLYAEDYPKTNTFNEKLQGFEKPPTAHYMRPFWLATQHTKQRDKTFCMGKTDSWGCWWAEKQHHKRLTKRI